MAFQKHVLVVANATATSDELRRALIERAGGQPTSFMLLVPATGHDHDAADMQLRIAIGRLGEAGLRVTGTVGDSDPVIAISEAWDPREFDEIVVSTLPMRLSKWLHGGLPERVYRLTGAPVEHVVSNPPKPIVPSVPAASLKRELGPLGVLAWGLAPRPGPRHEVAAPR